MDTDAQEIPADHLMGAQGSLPEHSLTDMDGLQFVEPSLEGFLDFGWAGGLGT
jgi:hypothetical protein